MSLTAMARNLQEADCAKEKTVNTTDSATYDLSNKASSCVRTTLHALTLALIACSSDGSDTTTKNMEKDTAATTFELKTELPRCTLSRLAEVYYVTSESLFYYCDGSQLRPIRVVGEPGVPGTPGADGETGPNGIDGKSALITQSPEPAGPTCAHGGIRIDTGLDDDRDGELEIGEIDDTAYVCNGAPASGVQVPGDGGVGESADCAVNNGGCDPLRACTNTPDGVSCGACPPPLLVSGDKGCSSPSIDHCETLRPPPAEHFVTAGTSVDVFARVFAPSFTDQRAGNDQDPRLLSQAGMTYFAQMDAPFHRLDLWSWQDAFPASTSSPNPSEDQYQATLVVPDHSLLDHQGLQLSFAFRFSVDGGQNWTYCLTEPENRPGTYSVYRPQ